jgi:uncharacterized protein YjbI with pentapeptide repeats
MAMRNHALRIGVLLMLAWSAASVAAEFGDHCTSELSMGRMNRTTCDIKDIFEGKTYCFGSESAKAEYMKDREGTIRKAETFYAKNAEPERKKMTQEEALQQIADAKCDLSNRDLGYLELDGKDLRHCKMTNTSFFGAYLRGANLSGANLQRAYLNLARLENTNFSGADLKDAIIFQAIFDKTNFKGANLTNARVIGTLGNVDMSGAIVHKGRFGLDVGNQPMGQMKFDSVGGNFANTDFSGSDLNIAGLRFANLTGANLRDTNLYRADLNQADLTGADMTGANLTDAELDGAVLKDVKGLDKVKGLESVKGKYKR